MIERGAFLKGLLVATGGLDIWSTPAPAPSPSPAPAGDAQIRVAALDGTVVTLDVETYLRGVVPVEASPAWPLAALEAQAIIARTYALEKKTLSRGYDLGTTVGDQRYDPAAEHPATTAAVDATRGLTVRYAGGPASIFYSACCGGHTEDANEVWGHTTLPYLRGVDDPYCVDAPDYRWTRSLPLDRARAALADRMTAGVTSVELVDPDPSGRPRSAMLHAADGSIVTLSVTELRRRWGTDVVRSTWLHRVSIETQAAPFVRIEGSGRGHGVGLCQWGARGMALAGADAAAILAHFFPGTAVTGG